MQIRIADRSDNERLLQLTSMTPMQGEISIRIDRHPDFFRLLDRRGKSSVLVAEQDGRIVGCISFAEVLVHVNGKLELVRYLGDLKVHPDFRGTGLAVRLVKFMHRQMTDSGADLVIWTAAYGNTAVLPFFEGRAGFPGVTPLGLFLVHQILPSRRRRGSSPYVVRQEPGSLELCRLYNEHFRKYQFGPYFESNSLQGAWHWVARSDNQLQAAISLVDVEDAKQNVLIRLPVPLGILLHTLRFFGHFLPIPRMPQEHRSLRILYVKAMAGRPGHEGALDLLIQRSRNFASERNYHFLAVGVHEKDPLGRQFKKYPKFTFKSCCFLAGLRRSRDEMARLAGGIPFEDYSLV